MRMEYHVDFHRWYFGFMYGRIFGEWMISIALFPLAIDIFIGKREDFLFGIDSSKPIPRDIDRTKLIGDGGIIWQKRASS